MFLMSFGENVFPPLPGDTFLVLGAVLVGRGRMDFIPAYLATVAGSLLGFMVMYGVGFFWGVKVFRGKTGKMFSSRNLEKVDQWFGRYGYGVLVANRFFAGFRAVVALCAGIARMEAIHVFLFASISCLIWNGLLMAVGMKVGENWHAIVRNYDRIVFILLCLFVLLWWLKANVFKNKPS